MAALNTLLLLLAALAIPGLINRTRALLAGRKGIRFAQHLYDVRLLLRKGAVYSPTTTAVFRAAPSVKLGTALVAALFVPVGDLPSALSFEGALIAFAYLLALGRVALILVDATVGFTEQDSKVAGYAHEQGKACIIVVNKWDLVEKDGKTMDKMSDDIRRDLSYMTYAPILFISAATGQRVPRLFEMINYVHNQSCMRISTGMLNNILADAQTRVQPPTDRGRRLKIYYMTQVGVCPPHFVVFCNERKLFHFSYQRYLENCIRNVFGLEGTPVIMSIREKGDKED